MSDVKDEASDGHSRLTAQRQLSEPQPAPGSALTASDQPTPEAPPPVTASTYPVQQGGATTAEVPPQATTPAYGAQQGGAAPRLERMRRKAAALAADPAVIAAQGRAAEAASRAAARARTQAGRAGAAAASATSASVSALADREWREQRMADVKSGVSTGSAALGTAGTASAALARASTASAKAATRSATTGAASAARLAGTAARRQYESSVTVTPEAGPYAGMTLTSAPLLRRAGARSIDLLLFGAPAATVGVVLALNEWWDRASAVTRAANPTQVLTELRTALEKPSFLLAFLLPLVALMTLEVLSNGGTPGRRLLGLRVVTVDGQQLGRTRQAVRTGVLYASTALPGWLLWPLASVMSSLVQRQRRALHDLIAGARVVALPPRAERTRREDSPRGSHIPNQTVPGQTTL